MQPGQSGSQWLSVAIIECGGGGHCRTVRCELNNDFGGVLLSRHYEQSPNHRDDRGLQSALISAETYSSYSPICENFSTRWLTRSSGLSRLSWLR